MALTFKGGAHPMHAQHEGKMATRDKPLEEFTAHTLVIPLLQHIGAPCNPLVAVGDEVALGQPIGEPQGLGAPIHASVSGKVVAIEPRPHVSGTQVMSVVIENDGQDRVHESIKPYGTVDSLSKEDIRKVLYDSGLVGMGGAAFPAHVKYNLKDEQVVEMLIINGAECEPYLTCDYRTMLEKTEALVQGTLALAKASSAKQAVIAIEDNKPEAVTAVEEAAQGTGVIVARLTTKYPQGGEKQLIFAVGGKEITAAALPITKGFVVSNVGTAATLYDCITTGLPLYKRAVTITGEVKNPSNLIMRIGTLYQDAIEHCGGFAGEPGRLISGGPMMGIAVETADIPVMKGTSGILAMKASTKGEETPCMLCGRCVRGCPMRINPTNIEAAYRLRKFDLTRALHAENCIKCGCCTYVCPAQRDLATSVDKAKQKIAMDDRKKAQAKKAN